MQIQAVKCAPKECTCNWKLELIFIQIILGIM